MVVRGWLAVWGLSSECLFFGAAFFLLFFFWPGVRGTEAAQQTGREGEEEKLG